MPLANWKGKFQGVGNGGLAGSIISTTRSGGIERGLAEALKRGYAAVSTDTGNTTVPFLGHPERPVDFAYRAVHEMTVTAKAIIHAESIDSNLTVEVDGFRCTVTMPKVLPQA